MQNRKNNRINNTKKLLIAVCVASAFALCITQPVSAARPEKKPVIKKITTTQSSIKIKWRKAKGCKKYIIYRKVEGGKYKKIAQVDRNKTSYEDKKVRHGKKYYYKIKSKRSKKSYTSSEKAVKLVKMKQPKVTVDFTNYHAVVKWNRVSKADGYIIYRKVKGNATYKKIAVVKGQKKTSFEDIYFHTLSSKEKSTFLLGNMYMDPTTNSFSYTVKAYRKMKYGNAYSECYTDGDFHLETPAIVSVTKQADTKADVKWGTVPNAQNYSIYSGYPDSGGAIVWKRTATVSGIGALCQSALVNVGAADTYFAVVAEAVKNGQTVKSTFDSGYHIETRIFTDKNILYLGDSITAGRPYIRTKEEKDIFSYPWRVKQLTGANYYNASVPGATVACNSGSACNIVSDIAGKIHEGKTPLHIAEQNSRSFQNFDVVVLSAGTNDYMRNVRLGNLNSENMSEFNGALNQIMDWIYEGSEQRVLMGKTPIKVVFSDLFYAERAYQGGRFADRFTHKNGIGHTLSDYQNALNLIAKKYKGKGMEVFCFTTRDIVTKQNCHYVTSDNLHMTRYTYAQIGNRLAEFMLSNHIIIKEEPEKEEDIIQNDIDSEDNPENNTNSGDYKEEISISHGDDEETLPADDNLAESDSGEDSEDSASESKITDDVFEENEDDMMQEKGDHYE